MDNAVEVYRERMRSVAALRAAGVGCYAAYPRGLADIPVAAIMKINNPLKPAQRQEKRTTVRVSG